MKKFKLLTKPAIVAILLLAVVFISCEDRVFKGSNKAISDQWEVRKKVKMSTAIIFLLSNLIAVNI